MSAPRQDVRLPPLEPAWLPFNAPVFQWERLGYGAYEAEWIKQGKRPLRALEVRNVMGEEAFDRWVASAWSGYDDVDEEC